MAKKYSDKLVNIIIQNYKNGISPYKMVKTIPELYNKRPSVIYNILKNNNIPVRKETIITKQRRLNRRKYNVNDNFFDVIDSENKAYWLGFIYADGFINTNDDKIGISLSIKDIEHLEKFKKDIEFTGNINIYEQKQGYNVGSKYCRILFTSENMKKQLIDKGVFELKTDKLKFPTEKQVPNKFIYDFIRGYIDGDGCITHEKLQKCGIWGMSLKITGTFDVIDNIQRIFNVQHLKKEQRHPERNKDNYSISIGGNKQLQNILDLVYKNSNIYLERKYKIYEQFCRSRSTL